MPLNLFFSWTFENFPVKVQGRFDVIVINHLSGRLDLINTDVHCFLSSFNNFYNLLIFIKWKNTKFFYLHLKTK